MPLTQRTVPKSAYCAKNAISPGRRRPALTKSSAPSGISSVASCLAGPAGSGGTPNSTSNFMKALAVPLGVQLRGGEKHVPSPVGRYVGNRDGARTRCFWGEQQDTSCCQEPHMMVWEGLAGLSVSTDTGGGGKFQAGQTAHLMLAM